MNGDEASGPPWDASDKVNLKLAKKDDHTSRAAFACHPTLGWLVHHLQRVEGGQSQRPTLVGGGETNGHQPFTTSVDILHAGRIVVRVHRLHDGLSDVTIAHTIFMVSAQIAQCAASRNLNALRNPNPPATSGKLVAAFALAATASGLILNRLQKHCKI